MNENGPSVHSNTYNQGGLGRCGTNKYVKKFKRNPFLFQQ